MRALALHPDVLLVRSAVLAVNCVVVRSPGAASRGAGGAGEEPPPEAFVVDSPVLPEELDSLPALLEQAGFPTPSGLLATHGDWDHLLGRLAFPGLALGCAQSSAERLAAEPGAAQRELRLFDEELAIERPTPLSLGSLQTLPVPGRCELGAGELELHRADGHTPDGMAILVPWAGVLIAGDYLSPIEIPTVYARAGVERYIATLERLRPLVAAATHVVPGHGAHSDAARALHLLGQDLGYLRALAAGERARLPDARRGAQQRRLHELNLAALARETHGDG